MAGYRRADFPMDLTRIPGSVRPWWRRVLREAFQVDSVAQVRGISHTALWFCRFHAATTRALSTTWDEWTAPDWGAYAEWLKDQKGFENRPLSHEYRRGQFLWLAAAARHAIDVGLPGTSEVTVAGSSRCPDELFVEPGPYRINGCSVGVQLKFVDRHIRSHA